MPSSKGTPIKSSGVPRIKDILHACRLLILLTRPRCYRPQWFYPPFIHLLNSDSNFVELHTFRFAPYLRPMGARDFPAYCYVRLTKMAAPLGVPPLICGHDLIPPIVLFVLFLEQDSGKLFDSGNRQTQLEGQYSGIL